jgi:hypothetical protein
VIGGGENSLPVQDRASAVSSRAYVIQIKDGGWLLIRITDGNESTVVLTMPVHAKALDSRAALVFGRYRDRYFLAQVRVAASEIGRKTLQAQDGVALAKKEKAHIAALALPLDVGSQSHRLKT